MVVALEALGTPLPDVAEAPLARVAERGPSPLWTIWRGVRVVSGVLLGMLLMLVAALVWVGQKRRL
jgi:hypothetical protein